MGIFRRNWDLKNIYYGHFNLAEFCNSKDGYSIKLNLKLVIMLEALRLIVGWINVTSGYRTTRFNKKVGGSYNSYHLLGLAADIKFNFNSWNKESLTKVLQSIGFTNVNFYWTDSGKLDRLHVDIGKTWNGKVFNYRDLKA